MSRLRTSIHGTFSCLDDNSAQSSLGLAAHIVKPARIHPASQSFSLLIHSLDALEDALESLSELASSNFAHPTVDAGLGHCQLGRPIASEAETIADNLESML